MERLVLLAVEAEDITFCSTELTAEVRSAIRGSWRGSLRNWTRQKLNPLLNLRPRQ
ncbi:MAG: hypothetical protein NWE88_08210 [Candidatus Bathyarchaeota archaeon]|nr:hypothetical protein [Candidatus Bathyarchaeota archaeon]